MISEFNNKPYYDTVNMTLYAENANDSYSFQNATKYLDTMAGNIVIKIVT